MNVRRENDSWCIDGRYCHPETGERTRLKKRVPIKDYSKKRAEELGRRLIEAAERGELFHYPGDAAFSGFAREYLDKKVRPNLKPSTLRSYEQILRVHAVPHFGSKNVRLITKKDIADYKAKMLRKLSPHTVCNHLGVLSRLFQTAIDWGYARRNPVQGVGMPRVETKPRPTWDLGQLERFLDAVARDRPDLEMLFRLAAFTGMRQGELLALTWDDVDLERGVIHVRHTLSDKQVTKTKNGEPRYVPVSPSTAERLRQHPRHMRSKLVFFRQDGTHMSGNQLRRPMVRAMAAAELDPIRFHDLRHSYATVLAHRGAPPIVVQKILGHRCPEATAAYIHRNESTMRQWVGLLDRPLGDASFGHVAGD